MSTTLFYLHGFRSSIASPKAQQLIARMRERGLQDALWCRSLPPIPREAVALVIAEAQQHLTAGTKVAFMGSSLGGFYATWLAEHFQSKAVLINPLTGMPANPQQWVGRHRHIHEDVWFDFTAEHIEQLKQLNVAHITKPQSYWLLVEEGDEVLDYRKAVAFYQGARQTVLPGGSHSFTHWPDYLDAAVDFCLR